MKPLVPLLAVAAAGAALLFHSSMPGIGARAGATAPAAAPGGWVSATPPPRRAAVRPDAAPRAVVYVVGAVAHPGVYRLPGDARVSDAVARTGGLRPDADPVAVNLAAHVRDGDEIVVPVRGAAPRAGAPHAHISRGLGTHPTSHRGRGSRRTAAPPAGLVDLNTADADTLATIPGIGPGLALRIVAFRTANGAFASADELLDVAGITDRRLDAILPYVIAR